MKLRSPLVRPVLIAAVVASTITMAAPAQAIAPPKPGGSYRMDTYHVGSITGEVVGQYAYAGPCGEAYWWGTTTPYYTVSFVTCPGK